MNSKKTSLTLGMAIALTLGIVIIFASPLSATTSIGSSSSMTMMLSPPPPSSSYSVQQQHGGIPAQNDIIQPGLYARGTIASLQNDKDGKPAWLVSGIWRGSLTNMTSNTMSSLLKNLPTATFNAVFNMVMLNGSALHKHQISNFILIGMSMPNEKTVVYNGTATITMKEGQVNDVPLSIRTLDDNVISIWVDPAKTMNHFGNTPIYGTIIQDVLVRK
jgi:ABC-type transport system involved in multi-copper enzyme maturation permease subunit